MTLILEQFESVVDSPAGVKKLREMVIDLAVRGKLVEQNPDDEPAEILLKKIETEKEHLFNAGLIRKPISIPSSNGFDGDMVPQGWASTLLGECIELISGQHLKADSYNEDGNGHPYLTGPADFGKVHPTAKRWTHEDRALAVKDDLLVTVKGAGIGKTNILDTPTAFISRQLMAVRPILVDCDYVHLLLRSRYESLQGQGVGIAIPGIGRDDLLGLPLLLPPLAEQKRIVAKVDELMALCDELEARQQERRTVHVSLNEAALDRLTTAENEPDFTAAWTRVRTNFDLLYSIPENVTTLRQTILQLAVMGKLVEQDPDDEPADVLLETMRCAKKQLIKEGNVGTEFSSASFKDNEIPYVVPSNWEWARLADFGLFLGGGTPSKQNSTFWDGSIPWVSPKDMKRRFLDDAQDHVTEEAIDNSSAKLIDPPALLLVVRGMILAHSFPVAITRKAVAINQDMKAIRLGISDTSEYLLLACMSERDRMLDHVERSSHGTCRISTDDVANFPIPLPPLAEQKRIVTRVNELLSLCDELEARLTQQQTDADRLTEAMIAWGRGHDYSP